MESLDRIGAVVAFVVYALLLYQQNRIMQRQNELMAGQSELQQHSTSRIRVYWPVLIMALATMLTWTAIGYDYHDRHRTVPAYPLRWTTTADQMPMMYGKTFRNQEVVLDGTTYNHCTFDDVTFIYSGTTPFNIVESTFAPNGKVYLKAPNDAIRGFIQLQRFLSRIPGATRFREGLEDENGNISPIIPGAPFEEPPQPTPLPNGK